MLKCCFNMFSLEDIGVYYCNLFLTSLFSSSSSYASRVRCIVNDPSKNVSSKEVARLKKLVAYWKEQAGRKEEDEDLEEIQGERFTTERPDGRHSK